MSIRSRNVVRLRSRALALMLAALSLASAGGCSATRNGFAGYSTPGFGPSYSPSAPTTEREGLGTKMKNLVRDIKAD